MRIAESLLKNETLALPASRACFFQSPKIAMRRDAAYRLDQVAQ
jgi:hypothetical protein